MIVGDRNIKLFFDALCWPTAIFPQTDPIAYSTDQSTTTRINTSCTREYVFSTLSSPTKFIDFYTNELGENQKTALINACQQSVVVVTPPQVEPPNNECDNRGGCSHCCGAMEGGCGDYPSGDDDDNNPGCPGSCKCCYGGHYAGCNCYGRDCFLGCRCNYPPSNDDAAARTCFVDTAVFNSQPQAISARFWYDVMVETIAFYNRFQTYAVQDEAVLDSILSNFTGAAHLPASHVVGSNCGLEDLWTERRVVNDGQVLNKQKG